MIWELMNDNLTYEKLVGMINAYDPDGRLRSEAALLHELRRQPVAYTEFLVRLARNRNQPKENPRTDWVLCQECGGHGYTSEQTDADRENRYPCLSCRGEGEVRV